MNYIGTVSPETHLKGDVFDLYDKAIQQAPDGDIPFLIFIDPNVPDSPQKGLPSYSDIPVDTVPWMKEIRDRLVEIWNAATEPTPESAVLITNFAFYYGDNDSPSPTGMGAFFPSLKPRVLQCRVAHIANHADNRAPSSVVILSADVPADRVAIGKISLRKALIDDCNRLIGFVFLPK